MKVLVYEHLVATSAPNAANESLYTEGLAMLQAVVRALAAVANVEVTFAHGSTLDVEMPSGVRGIAVDMPPAHWLRRRAPRFDAVLPIAPETGGVLAELCASVSSMLLVPGVRHQRLFADKLATAERLEPWSIPSRRIDDAGRFEPFSFDAAIRYDVAQATAPEWSRYVVKPRDGAGSLHTLVVDSASAPFSWIRDLDHPSLNGFIVQPFWPGLPCSVGIVADGLGNAVVLPPVRQTIGYLQSGPGAESICYQGGSGPLVASLARRVVSLADYLLDAIVDLSGYVGIDVLLASGSDGAFDRIVEVNPRPTTSVVAYSHLLGAVLGQLLVQQLDRPNFGLPATSVSTKRGRRRYLMFPEGVAFSFQPNGIFSWEPARPPGESFPSVEHDQEREPGRRRSAGHANSTP